MKRFANSGLHKRSGVGVNPSCIAHDVGMVEIEFCDGMDSLSTFCAAGKDVVYEAMNREDWNWRVSYLRVARKALQQIVSPDDTARAG
jgi:hypothetical protein